MAKRQRKKFLINKDFQYNFIFHSIMMAFIVCSIFYTANYFFFWKLINAGKDIGLSIDHVFFKFIGEQQRTMNEVFLITSLCVFASLFLYGIFYSHRIAGPLFKLKRYLRDRANGEVHRPIAFRKHDYFKELAHAVNDYIYQIENPNNRNTKKVVKIKGNFKKNVSRKKEISKKKKA